MKSQLKVLSGVKAGGLPLNHNQLRVRSGVKAGGMYVNHNQRISR